MKALLNFFKKNPVTALRPKLRVEVVTGDFDPKADHVVADMVLAGFGQAVIIPSQSGYNVKVSPRKTRYSAAEFREIAQQLRQHNLLEMTEFCVAGEKFVHGFHRSYWDDEEAHKLGQSQPRMYLQEVTSTR